MHKPPVLRLLSHQITFFLCDSFSIRKKENQTKTMEGNGLYDYWSKGSLMSNSLFYSLSLITF